MDHDTNSLIAQLQNIDPSETASHHIVLLPDFFLDHIVHLPDFDATFNQMHRVYTQKGGNISPIHQNLQQGGNAANTALALARLGMKSHLICKTNPFGTVFLNQFLKPYGVDLTHVKTDGTLAMTTALEFDKANVMLSDAGSVACFRYDTLTDDDHTCIANADLVGVVNWTLNEAGTDLARNVFHFAAQHHVKTFLDTGDPSHRPHDIPTLVNHVITSPDLTNFSVNENELTHYARHYPHPGDTMLECAQTLKHHIHARLDVHTSTQAYTLTDTTTIVPTYQLPAIHRATGAGDCWNAGNLFADLNDLTTTERLLFANAVAGCYLSQPYPLPPTLQDVIQFMITTPRRSG